MAPSEGGVSTQEVKGLGSGKAALAPLTLFPFPTGTQVSSPVPPLLLYTLSPCRSCTECSEQPILVVFFVYDFKKTITCHLFIPGNRFRSDEKPQTSEKESLFTTFVESCLCLHFPY